MLLVFVTCHAGYPIMDYLLCGFYMMNRLDKEDALDMLRYFL